MLPGWRGTAYRIIASATLSRKGRRALPSQSPRSLPCRVQPNDFDRTGSLPAFSHNLAVLPGLGKRPLGLASRHFLPLFLGLNNREARPRRMEGRPFRDGLPCLLPVPAGSGRPPVAGAASSISALFKSSGLAWFDKHGARLRKPHFLESALAKIAAPTPKASPGAAVPALSLQI